MPYIPPNVAENDLSSQLSALIGTPRKGKVRDTYPLPRFTKILLVVASDRVSIFDFVLGSLVPNKGAVLTAMTVFWLTQVVRRVANHLISYGAGIDDFLPKALKNNPDLQSRMLVVQELEMVPVECIVRAYLTGSGWSAYEKTGQICGITLPEGLHDGSKLPWGDIFTPTTKAEEGHDEHLGAADVLSQYGPGLQTLSFRAFSLGSRHAEERGILLADTKFEFGRNTEGRFVLADEVMTPDSSRFWLNSDYEEVSAKKRSPSGFDKQLVREWGKTVLTPFTGTDGEQIVGLQNLDPTLQEHREFVGGVEVPEDVVGETTRRYLDVFYKLTGYSLRDFQRLYMGIKV